MPLSGFSLSNFKPFHHEQSAKIAKITLVYGPNSGGKSSIIQALMLLRQTFDAKTPDSTRLNPRGEMVDLGSFKSLVHKHDLNLPVSFRFDFTSNASREGRILHGVIPKNAMRHITLRYKAATSVNSRKVDTSVLENIRYRLAYELDDTALDVSLLRDYSLEKEKLESALFGLNSIRADYKFANTEAASSLVRYLSDLEQRRRERTDNDDARESIDFEAMHSVFNSCHFISDTGLPSRMIPSDRTPASLAMFRANRHRILESMADELQVMMDRLSYLGPLRMSPARHYVSYDTGVEVVGKQGEHVPQLLHREKQNLDKKINNWFKSFEIPYELKISDVGDEITGGIITIALRDVRTLVTVGPADVGFGIGQLLPVLVQGLVASNRIICVEQPEIHLHPRLQAHLADFIIETSGANKPEPQHRNNNNQWIIETHSESLILRLQRRIREKLIKSEDVSILYVLPTSQGAQIMELRLDEDGEFIDEWPHGVFEESFYETFGGRK